MRSPHTRAGWSLALLSMAALLANCNTMPTMPGPDGGIADGDENTDPRFVRTDKRGTIGQLRIVGQNVFVDDRRLERGQRLANNASVRTGPRSWVRVEFDPAIETGCRTLVQGFRQGNLYGESKACPHEVTGEPGTVRAERVPTRYHLGAQGRSLVITVIEGTAVVWASGDPSRPVRVGPMQEARIEPGAVAGPTGVTRRQVQERTAWRTSLERGLGSGIDIDPGLCERYATEAVSQYRQNLRYRCGFDGPLWAPDHATHLKWCLAEGEPKSLEARTAAREQALRECRAQGQGTGQWEGIVGPILQGIVSELLRRSGESSAGGRATETDTGSASQDGSAPERPDPDSTNPDVPATQVPSRLDPGMRVRIPTTPNTEPVLR
ncbi:hypothetical protein ABC977_15180 [Thioalkalicoccus limnaeus]|uniref:Lysozyme inhibitor LprI N-terminal domain-containing protein n=1 Tax=Thioalkalicoccus limnaeus TaxID=120681 RepID=A0ABV4BGT9_9GAMM